MTLHSVNENELYTINTDHIKSIRNSIQGGSTIKFRFLQGIVEKNDINVKESPEVIIKMMNNVLICDLVK